MLTQKEPAGCHQPADVSRLSAQNSTHSLSRNVARINDRGLAGRHRWRVCFILALLLFGLVPAPAGAWTKKIDEFPDLGAMTSNPNNPGWATVQKKRLHNLKPTIFDMFMETTFQTKTSHIQDAINEGARIVVMRSPARHESLTNNSTCINPVGSAAWWDCYQFAMTTADINVLFGSIRQHPAQSWYDSQSLASFVQAHPDVLFYIEVGNEPDVGQEVNGRDAFDSNSNGAFGTTDATAYRNRLIQIADYLHANYNYPNLRLIASMPVDGNTYISTIVGSASQVDEKYDIIGIHLYGASLDTSTVWEQHYLDVLNAVRTGTANPLYVTETGICDPSLAKQTKAQRMRDWYLRNAGINRITGVVLFELSHYMGECSSGSTAGYEIESGQVAGDDEFMAEVLAERFVQDNANWPSQDVIDTYTCHDMNGSPGCQLATAPNTSGDYTTEGPMDAEWWSVGGGTDYNGSLVVYGYPLTYWDGDDQGWLYSYWRIENGVITQYFQRNVMEWHPENATTGTNPAYRVLLRREGVKRAQWKGYLYASEQPTGTQPAFTSKGAGNPTYCEYFANTPTGGHNVCYGMKDYWHSKGRDLGDAGVSFAESLALWGYPISEEFTECNDGVCRTTQYFERAVIQYFPANPPGWQFQGILVGKEDLSGSY